MIGHLVIWPTKIYREIALVRCHMIRLFENETLLFLIIIIFQSLDAKSYSHAHHKHSYKKLLTYLHCVKNSNEYCKRRL